MSSILLAEVLRGEQVESRHLGAFVVADPKGRLVLHGGDADRAIFPRSAIKALQALPLLLSGAADRWGLEAAALALACASHVGAPVHTQTARSMLQATGGDESRLECGTHWPSSSVESHALAAAGQTPGPLHNNCSGKHAGFICTCIATGREPRNYIAEDHPTMREVTSAVSVVTGADLAAQTPAIDGCSIPAFQISLRDLASGFARFGSGQYLPADFARASTRLRAAVAAKPMLVAGEGRFDTVIAAELGRSAFVKVGAEGVYCGSLPDLSLGFALKCDDGSVRAAEVAVAGLLRHYVGSNEVLDHLAGPVLRNRRGVIVGRIRPATLS